MIDNENLRFPIGRFQAPYQYSKEDLAQWTNIIRTYPE
jgi:hypothetical protein